MEILERWTRKSGTHGEITKYAISLLKSKEKNVENESYLISSSNDPDEIPFDLWVGHFYGSQSETKKGSYLSLYIGGIELNALNNFVEWFNGVQITVDPIEKAKDTGSTLHFIQDITAPHHFHNLPAITSENVFGWDTHREFEKRAHKLITDDNNYLKEASAIFDQLNFNGDPRAFAIDINNRALTIVPNKNVLKDETKWDAIINQLLPLAIAASARVIEKL
jgi:hypothetical protein